MFDGKTLLAVGCSHVFAPLGEDFNPETCHQRSWVKKLERLGNFKNSINLAQSGASNQRSERVLMEYLEANNYNDLVLAFGLTDLSRFELPRADKVFDHLYHMSSIGPWCVSSEHTLDKRELNFMETLYGEFHSTNYETVMINRKMLYLNSFLNRLNIEHYFIEIHCHGGSIMPNQFGIDLPLIHFKDDQGLPTNAIRHTMNQGYTPDYTGHFDHDGHEFLAKLFYDQIKGIKSV